MGEAIKEKDDRTTLCKLNNGYPEDGLPGILQTNHKKIPVSYSEQPDLTLRLSLGGVCSQNLKASPLIRSASVAGVITQTTEVGGSGGLFYAGLSLSLDRTSSLPSETEQKGLIKLKEWQSIRRMEAKKRLVGQRNGRPAPEVKKSAHGFQSGCQTPDEEQERHLSSPEKKVSGRQWSPKQRKIMHGNPAETSGEARANTWAQNNPRKKTKKNGEVSADIAGMKVMKTMPIVMATGDGPNGRKVEGFLYTYKRGEVSIVCVCHGSVLSPGEFVKHAAGVDVVNPMKHIRVCSTAASFYINLQRSSSSTC